MNHRAIFITAVLAMSFSGAGAEEAHVDHLPGNTVVDDAGKSGGTPDRDRDAKPESGQDMGPDMSDGTMPGMRYVRFESRKNHEMNQGVDVPENTESKGGLNHGAKSGEAAMPPDTRDPHAYSDGYDFRPLPRMHMGDQHSYGAFLADRFELAHTSEERYTSYDVLAWYGRDFDRLWFKSEGEVDAGRLQQARSELLWGHALTAFWDAQVGARYDSGVGPGRAWLALGLQGLAPYWFELETTAYVGDAGRSALRVKAEYELLFTQKLILQPRVEAEAYGKSDAGSGLGSGLSGLTAGIRLRYEIRREFAPYIGVEWAGVYGGTADYARAAARAVDETRLVAGVRFWF